MKNRFHLPYLLAFLFLQIAIFIGCSDDSSTGTAGGGTETGNSIAVRDSIIIRDSIVIRDSIIVRDSIIIKDSTIIVDSVVIKDSTNIIDSILPTAKISISGYVQKGPFLNGSSVYVFELDEDGLTQTGKAFRGKTENNGQFKISNIAISSQYAILEGSGYFINEVSGKESEGRITLSAIVDVTERSNVNINFLTQLEFDRVTHLVTVDGKTVPEAKLQAEKEILRTFFGESASASNFEELNIFGSTDDDAKLLALSIMVLADQSDAKFSNTLAEISADIETDGTYDNESFKAGMADYVAFYANIKEIRKNIEAISENEVPDFEKHLYYYWVNNFGLGKCSSDNAGSIVKNKNKSSSYSETLFKCNGTIWEPYYFNPDCEYGTLTDERDGNTYKTTTIGEQTWMAENLRYAENGYNCLNDNESYCKKYGFYYRYEQISCPKGWHLPDTTEWAQLFDAVGGSDIAGDSLRAKSGWNTTRFPQTVGNTDSHCFTALAGGVYPFGDEGLTAYYYTSSTILNANGVVIGAWNRGINPDSKIVKSNMYTTTAASVRCVKDSEEE